MTAPIKMKAIGFTQSFPITEQGSLFEFETDVPEVKDNDLLVKVSATSINPADAKIRIRNAKDKILEQPKVLGYDAVGEVIAKGANAEGFEVGDRVYYAGDVTRMGANAQYQAVDYRITAHAPKSLSDESAAVMPLATLTAWEALFDRLRVRPEERKSILIIGGAGGVGSITIQLAKQLTKDRCYTLVAIDIKGLRHINDKLGPQVGDECLIAVANRIRQFSDELGGFHARIGGDEFLTVYPSVEANQVKCAVADLIEQLQAPYQIKSLKISLRFNAGIVQYPGQGVKADDLMRRVLIAVDAATTSQQSLYYYQDGEDEAHLDRLIMLDELKQAIDDDNGQLFMTYQPKLNIKSQKIDKVESLIRWQRDDGSWVSPEVFIDLAEQSGVIVDLTAWVVKTVVTQVARWQEQDIIMQAAINVSAQDIAFPSFFSHLAKQLKENDVNGQLITIELTERDMIENEEQGIKALENLKSLGVKISLDDYGVGQTSLGRLKLLPIDELKLDKCFILQLEQSKQDQYIVESTINLGHQLGFSVVAEGVENKASLDFLKLMKCDYAQGYYLSRPLKSEQFLQWLEVYNEAS